MYTQLERVGSIALFRRTKGGWTDYELIRVQSHDGYEIAGNKIPPGESYPSANSWGTHGWTFRTIETAARRFAALVAKTENQQ